MRHADSAEGDHDRTEQQGDCQEKAGGREHVPDDTNAQDADEEHGTVGRDHSDHEVLEGVDVLHQPSQEVAAVECRELCRPERVEVPVHAYPKVSQDAERRVMPDQALAVPGEPPRDGERPHPDDRYPSARR